MIAGAIYTLLNAESTITDLLGKFENQPAIFTFDQGVAPSDATVPHISIMEVGGGEFGTRGSQGAEVLIQIDIWGSNELRESIRSLAWRVKEVVDRGCITPVGYTSLMLVADPPQRNDDRDGFPGYRVIARTKVLKD